VIEVFANVVRWGWFIYTLVLALSSDLSLDQMIVGIVMVGYIGGWMWWVVATVTLSFLSGFFLDD
jgi:hypothetical protein